MNAKQDPLGYDLPLPLTARYYPMGFPLEVATNSPEVIAAADWLWKQYPPVCGPGGAVLRVRVDDRDASAPLCDALPRGGNHLVAMVHGPENFAVCDLASSFTLVCLTRDVARDHAYVRYHFLEPAGCLMIDSRHLVPIHASCAALQDRAVILCGDSGAGKTSLAYQCARSGWTYLSDDAVHIVRGRTDHKVVGRPFRIRFRETARLLFPELNRFTPEFRPNGKLDFEIETATLGMSVALAGNAAHIVFLNRQSVPVNARLAPFARADAARRLGSLTCYGDDAVRSRQSRTLDEFLQLPVSELTYRGLEEAESILRTLICH